MGNAMLTNQEIKNAGIRVPLVGTEAYSAFVEEKERQLGRPLTKPERKLLVKASNVCHGSTKGSPNNLKAKRIYSAVEHTGKRAYIMGMHPKKIS